MNTSQSASLNKSASMTKYGAMFITNKLHKFPSKNEVLPVLRNGPVHNNIKDVRKKRARIVEILIPTVGRMLNNHLYAHMVGEFNELEYSGNIRFYDCSVFSDITIQQFTRIYVISDHPIYHYENKFSTIPFKNCKLVFIRIVTRFDYESEVLTLVTSKFKVLREKFTYRDVTYSLTASIEVEFPELKDAIKYEIMGGKTKRIMCWSLLLIIDSNNYKFRIAFRKALNADIVADYECNIECEDYISGPDFIVCFDLISKFYKQQYIEQDGVIVPFTEINPNSMNLTDQQWDIFHSMRLDDNAPATAPLEPNTINPDVLNFVKFISLNHARTYTAIDLPLTSFSNIECKSSHDATAYLPDDSEGTSKYELC